MAYGSRKVLILFIILLLGLNVYVYFNMSVENNRLKYQLQQEQILRGQLEARIKDLEYRFEALNASYIKVLQSNRQLEEALKYLQGKLIVPYNYTLMTPSEFAEKYNFAYTEEMVDFVRNATGWWDGSEEDLLSDLYRIYRAWRDIFIIDPNASISEFLPFINIGGWNYDETDLGDDYLREVILYQDNPIEVAVDYAALAFKHHRGLCGAYAHVLVTLYYVYFDMVGKKISVAYLSIGIGKERHHGCVLMKGEGNLVAIVDWEPITTENNMIKFVPLESAKRLHSEYWSGEEIRYDGVWMRPNISIHFGSYEEFTKWLIEDF